MAKFHGCDYAFIDDEGVPIQKAWTVATKDVFLYNELAAHQCPGCVRHRWCGGKFSKRSENYTDSMAYGTHEAWRKSVVHDLTQQVKVVPCAVAATKSQRMKERISRRKQTRYPKLQKTTWARRRRCLHRLSPTPSFTERTLEDTGGSSQDARQEGNNGDY